MPAPIIFVDTTEFHRSLLLDSAGWRELLAHCKHGRVVLAVPEVVLLEAARHYRRRVDAQLSRAGATREELKRLGVIANSDVSDIEAVAGVQMRAYLPLITRQLEASGARILPIPTISHGDLLMRDLEVRKPFKDNGAGYRDALVWETVLEHLRTALRGTRAILVTNNSDDFCEAKRDLTLARSLSAEVEQLGRELSIERSGSIPDVLQLARELIADQDVYTQPEETFRGAVTQAVIDAAEQLVGKEIADPDLDEHGGTTGLAFPGVLPAELTGSTIDVVYPDETSVDFNVYDELDGDTRLAHASIDAEVTVDGFVHKADYYSSDDGEFGIIESDWNDHMMYVGFTAQVTLWFDLVVSGSTVETISFDYGEGRSA